MSRGTTATGTGPVKFVEMPWRTPTRASEMSAVEAASSLGRVISASSPTQTRAATQAAATSTAKRAKSRCRSPSRRIAPATIGPEDGPRVVIAETMPIVVPSLSGVETVSVRFMPIGTTMPVPRACTMRCRGPARCGDEHDDEVRGERAEDRAGQQQAQGAQEEPVRAHRAVEEAGDGHHDRGGGYAGGGDPADGARADARVVHHRGQDHVEEGLVEGGEEGRGGRPRRRSPRRRCGWTCGEQLFLRDGDTRAGARSSWPRPPTGSG